MQKVVCVSSAKVPIVKIWDPELKLACDMNVNNTLALENTRMVRTYVSIDDRVRQLAMIIKYWTRRRVINDAGKQQHAHSSLQRLLISCHAAFGGTLSSYTWICMIIAFLQLRNPPVLPALHEQDSSLKLIKKDGTRSEFADDTKKLYGFGGKSKESLASLLFQFFRFYAHEFDYDKYVLSIRTGKLLIKTEKNWHIGSNNKLCVEEPFNTIRNLGNTADDFSFRGLQEELQRAFRLIADGKFAEACEEFVFPKEEERKWEKPASAPKPILVRSASQQGTRVGRNNGFPRNRYQNRVQNANRRASSSVTYDTNAAFAQNGMPPTMSPQDLLWYQVQNPQLAVSQEILASSLSALAQHESNMRFQLYTQAHSLNQQQALAHAQRLQGASAPDRSRTNSFDNPPLSAPIRQDYIYGFPYTLQHAPYFHPSYTTFPASPASTSSTTNGASEYRRSLHRTAGTSESGGASGSGALRSQSQPASRSSMTTSQVMQGYSTSSQSHNGMSALPLRQVNGAAMPNYLPGEIPDADFDDAALKALSDSPPEDEAPRFTGYYLNDQPSPNKKMNGFQNVSLGVSNLTTNSQGRRRLSTDQSPQSVLDRRMKRTSRSPSPLGHARAFSTGMNSAPLLSAPFAHANGQSSSKPLMVNGSVSKSGVASGPARSPLGAEPVSSDDYNTLYIQQSLSPHNQWTDQILAQLNGTVEQPSPAPAPVPPPAPVSDRPVIVNGSLTSRSPPSLPGVSDAPLHQRLVMGAPSHLYNPTMPGDVNNMLGLSRIHTRQQLAPLDLATSEYVVPQDQPHLSPVYEHRTPSPTVVRKSEGIPFQQSSRAGSGKEPRQGQKSQPTGPSSKQHDRSPVLEHKSNGLPRENGHSRNGKSPTDHFGSWQKQKPRKKGGMDLKQTANGHAQSEQPPKNEADRKGG